AAGWRNHAKVGGRGGKSGRRGGIGEVVTAGEGAGRDGERGGGGGHGCGLGWCGDDGAWVLVRERCPTRGGCLLALLGRSRSVVCLSKGRGTRETRDLYTLSPVVLLLGRLGRGWGDEGVKWMELSR